MCGLYRRAPSETRRTEETWRRRSARRELEKTIGETRPEEDDPERSGAASIGGDLEKTIGETRRSEEKTISSRSTSGGEGETKSIRGGEDLDAEK
ncbi:hypothetical protein U1Q18_000052 [Sarracenia purpurea var. burkii]